MIIHDGGSIILDGDDRAWILLLNTLNNLFNITHLIDFYLILDIIFLTFRLFLTLPINTLLLLAASIVAGHLLLILFGLLDGVGSLARFFNIILLFLS